MLTRWSCATRGLHGGSWSLEVLLRHLRLWYPWKLPVLQLMEVLLMGDSTVLCKMVGKVPGLWPCGISKMVLPFRLCWMGSSCLLTQACSFACDWMFCLLQLLRTLVTGLGVLTALLFSEGLLLEPYGGAQGTGLHVLSGSPEMLRWWSSSCLSSLWPSCSTGLPMTNRDLPPWAWGRSVDPWTWSLSILRKRLWPFFRDDFSWKRSSPLKLWGSPGDGGPL